MKKLTILVSLSVTGVCMLLSCSESNQKVVAEEATLAPLALANTGKATSPELQEQIKLGEHLVMIAGCHECHTPKKMTDKGPELDFSLALSGHPAKMPAPDVNRKEIEAKGLGVTQTLTAWVGPWGISYGANLTSDKTGIGTWTEENFFTAMKEGKYKGMKNGRMLLPPMPWQFYQHMTNQELRAIFAYLKSTKPINNVVPAPQPPLSATSGK